MRPLFDVYVLDTGSGRTVSYNADERFAHCSTYKALAAGILLERATGEQLDQVVHYGPADLVEHSPITAQHVQTGMTLRDVMAAALEYSDNAAGNLLLDRLGGPQGLPAALRGLGDTTTESDRREPALNAVGPGDTGDTSTARALSADLRDLVLGAALPGSGRGLLAGWLQNSTTGGPDVRAGVPPGWKVADKTGGGAWGARDDIAVAWPPGGAPVVIAVLSRGDTRDAPADDTLIADATRTALAALRA